MCIYCASDVPTNAHYVWTDRWYANLVCDWECDSGFDTATDGTCPAHVYPPLLWFLPAALALAVAVLLVCMLNLRRVDEFDPPPYGPDLGLHREESRPVYRGDEASAIIGWREGVIRLRIP
jgi:hypothetical protein